MKETGIVKVKWIPKEENCADIFTKNLSGKTFQKHVGRMCKDEDSNLIQWEGVTMGSRRMEDVNDELVEVPNVSVYK